MNSIIEFKEETRKVLVTTTLVVVLFTTMILGGGTMPLMKFLESRKRSATRRPLQGRGRKKKKEITMSKTKEVSKCIGNTYVVVKGPFNNYVEQTLPNLFTQVMKNTCFVRSSLLIHRNMDPKVRLYEM